MDWQFISHHLISGYIPVAAALVLYFVILLLIKKKQTFGHILVSFVFCFYLVGILTMTGVCIQGTFSPKIVYTPIVGMMKGPIEAILNIILFVPLGFFLPLLYEKFNRIFKVAIIGLLISLSVEIAQMFGTGTSDINDLITNTVGACVGYGVYKLLYKVIPNSLIKKIQVKDVQCYYELPLFWIGTMLIMLTIQIIIFHALFPTGGEMQTWN